MDHLSREREDERTATTRPPEPAPAAAGPLEWASAMGNQAVAQLARQSMHPELEEEAPEAEAEVEAEEAPPAEVEQLEAQGIGMGDLAGLGAVDDMAEDELPD